MKRREFFKLAGGVAAGWPLAALAQQQAGKLPRIGHISTEPSELTEAFSQGLREAGYVDGQNIILDTRYHHGSLQRIDEFAHRINQKWLLIVSLAILGLIGYCLFNVATTPSWQSALSFLEGTVQSGFFYVNSYSLMQRSVRSNVTGRASGLFVTCVYLPAAFSGSIFAALVGWRGWHGAAMMQMCLLLAVPIFAMLFFQPAKTSCPSAKRKPVNEERPTVGV
jgi:hypothetical protein